MRPAPRRSSILSPGRARALPNPLPARRAPLGLAQATLGCAAIALAAAAPGAAAPVTRTTGSPAAGTLTRSARAGLDALAARLGAPPSVRRRLVPSPSARPRERVTWLGGFRLPQPGATPAARAQAFLQRFGAALGLVPPVQATVHRVIPTRGRHVVRFALRLHGLPVSGTAVAVTVQGGAITSAAGGLPPLHTVDAPRPSLSAQAAALRLQHRAGVRPYRYLGLGYVVRGDAARLVHRFDLYLGSPPERLLVAVDATTGAVLQAGSGFRRAQGWVYDPSPAGGQPVVTRDLAELTDTASLTGSRARAFQCGASGGGMEDLPCQDRYQSATPTDADGNYFYPPAEPSNNDPFAEVQAYYHVTEHALWLESRFGFVWSCAGRSAIDVHVNMLYPNAFYGDADGDPEMCDDVTLGQGNIDYAYDAEVIYHEFDHGLNNQTASLGCPDEGLCMDDLGVNLMPNAIDEALADYFSMAHTGDPYTGEYAGQDTGDPYIRTALNAKRCPWDLDGESHDDGEIVMGGAWSLRQSLGAEKADALVYAALAALPPDAQLDTWAAVLGQAATDLAAAGQLDPGDVSQVSQMLGPTDRNLVDCDRFVPLDGRPPGQSNAYVFTLPSYPGVVDEWPLSLQFTLTAPPEARRLQLFFTPQYGSVSEYTLYVRRDQPVYAQVQQGSPYVVADYTFGGSPYEAHITAQSVPPLRPGSTYYITAVYAASDYDYVEVSGYVTTGPPMQPDAGVPDATVPPDSTPPPDVLVVPPDVEPLPPDSRPPSATYQPGSFAPRQGCACTGARGSQDTSSAGLLLMLGLLGLALRRSHHLQARPGRCSPSRH